MSLKRKMIHGFEIKGHGDVIHDLFGRKPHHVSNIASTKVQGCDLHDGEFGTVGSIISWSYNHVDGKARIAKQLIEDIDEKNKSIRFKMLEGDLMEHYKTLVATLHIQIKGENELVTWTFDYEKLNADEEDPTETMNFLVALIKDIETHHSK